MFPAAVDLWFDWHLTNRCNFFCDYCHPQIKFVLNKKHLDERTPGECADAFDRTGKICGILMSGGEPFAFPSYVDMCELLTIRHYIAMNTNLSMTAGIRDFTRRINPDRVSSVLAAVHVAERARNGLGLEDFATNFLILREAGFAVTAAYVLHPDLLSRAEQDFIYLRSAGVDRLVGKVFKGIWDKRKFPTQYNATELAVVSKLTDTYHVGAAYLDREWDFRGLPCKSGTRSFKVTVTGDVNRCVSVSGSMGNFFDGTFLGYDNPEACTAKHIRVLSECADQLTNLPTDFEDLLKKRM